MNGAARGDVFRSTELSGTTTHKTYSENGTAGRPVRALGWMNRPGVPGEALRCRCRLKRDSLPNCPFRNVCPCRNVCNTGRIRNIALCPPVVQRRRILFTAIAAMLVVVPCWCRTDHPVLGGRTPRRPRTPSSPSNHSRVSVAAKPSGRSARPNPSRWWRSPEVICGHLRPDSGGAVGRIVGPWYTAERFELGSAEDVEGHGTWDPT